MSCSYVFHPRRWQGEPPAGRPPLGSGLMRACARDVVDNIFVLGCGVCDIIIIRSAAAAGANFVIT